MWTCTNASLRGIIRDDRQICQTQQKRVFSQGALFKLCLLACITRTRLRKRFIRESVRLHKVVLYLMVTVRTCSTSALSPNSPWWSIVRSCGRLNTVALLQLTSLQQAILPWCSLLPSCCHCLSYGLWKSSIWIYFSFQRTGCFHSCFSNATS